MGRILTTEGTVYGYVRVSTKEQHLDRQLIAMEQYGVLPENIYADQISGKDFNRPAYKKLIRKIKQGDIIIIKSVDRLGRNYQDIIDQWRLITQEIGCGIHVIDTPTLDASGDPKDLISRFITDAMLTVLSFVAQNERENIKQRQKEGIKAAKARGVNFGRPRSTIPKDFWSYYIRWRMKETSTKSLIKETKLSTRTFYRRIRELDRRYHSFTIKQLKELVIDKDIPYEYETEDERISKAIHPRKPKKKDKHNKDEKHDEPIILIPMDRN